MHFYIAKAILDGLFRWFTTRGQRLKRMSEKYRRFSHFFPKNLGSLFAIHPMKSILCPVQAIIYLSFIIDSVNMMVELVQSKKDKDKIKQFYKQILKNDSSSIWDVAKLIGLMMSQLFYRELELGNCKALRLYKGLWEKKLSLCFQGRREEIQWWLENIQNCRNCINL